ncbi:MAG: tetratricopeptide repeat protein [Dehalococcoidales bacterium]|nr:tetratricopeptide repeat protein [Dehalococcoidales bacterium]
MSYQEEGQVRPRRQLTKEAIALAMQGRWREAIAANISIIGSFPNDVGAYNRLGRAYMELGDYSRAKEAYERAMELDSYNVIATKNLHRLSCLGEAVVGLGSGSQKAEPQHFIEETGKAGVVDLYRLALPEILARMVAGDKVYLRIDGTSLVVEDGRGEYLGQVDPKQGRQLIKLMEGGNKYTAAIISSAEDMMSIVIREVYHDPSQAGRLSFPAKGIEELRPYVGERILRRELEYEEELVEEPGYTIVSEDGTELLPEESPDIDDDKASDEE